jgi:hypothetical protein
MDYIITEQRLITFIDNYITQTVGELEMKNSTNVRGTKDDFELVDKNGNLIFEFVDDHLGVSQRLFLTISSLFNMNDSETENMFVRWFEKKFPNENIVASYYSIYY